MATRSDHIAAAITQRTHLRFSGIGDSLHSSAKSISLRTADLPIGEGLVLALRLTPTRIECEVRPETFARALLDTLHEPDNDGRPLFDSIAGWVHSRSGRIRIHTRNGTYRAEIPTDRWPTDWSEFRLSVSSAPFPLRESTPADTEAAIIEWGCATASLMMTLLPIEEKQESGEEEGTLTRVIANRYERSRRNRAAALTIHGTSCAGCGIDFGAKYGPAFIGRIHVHHKIPVSQMGPGYVVNPSTDLIPLCPNCHHVVHTQDPPLTVEELKELLAAARTTKPSE